MKRQEQQERLNALYPEMTNLLETLDSEDYKTTKNIEFGLAGKEYPYDPVELHQKHEAMRARINEIEDEIKMLKKADIEDDDVLPEES